MSVITATPAPSVGTPTANPHHANPMPMISDDRVHSMIAIRGFETLNKWKDCTSDDDDIRRKIPERMVYEHNRARAARSGFPSVLEVGRSPAFGLTDHEVAAIFGWTTGDYRMINPIARDPTR
eukprot:3821179-Rhodomonas_salina.1